MIGSRILFAKVVSSISSMLFNDERIFSASVEFTNVFPAASTSLLRAIVPCGLLYLKSSDKRFMKNAFESFWYSTNMACKVPSVNVLCARLANPKVNKTRKIVSFFMAVALRRHACLVKNNSLMFTALDLLRVRTLTGIQKSSGRDLSD